jgi:hypothetical protein
MRLLSFIFASESDKVFIITTSIQVDQNSD